MAGDDPFDSPWDDDDNDNDSVAESSLADAFDEYLPGDDPTDQSWDGVLTDDPSEGQIETLLFTATNPAGTVSVTVTVEGTVLRVELSPAVTTMPEAELAREILTIATLARRQSQAGLHVLITAGMRQIGHTETEARSYAEHELRLPTPDTVHAEQAELFAAHYTNDWDRSHD